MTEPRGQGSSQEEATTVQLTPPAQATPQAMLELRAARLTDVGQARPHNEDYVDYSIPTDHKLLAAKGAIFLVADGMGGHQAGEVASKGAVEAAMAHYLADTGHEVGTSLVRAFRAANQQLYAQAEGDPSKGGMGTTLVAAVILGRRVYVGNVGDSRAYLINKRAITQITEDHSWVEEQVRAGLLNEEQARRHPQRNLVTRALGSKPAVEIDLFEGEISAGDTLLLCSDGLTGRLTDDEIADIVLQHQAQEAARRLVALANERGGNDNITVLIINAEESTPTVKAPLAGAEKPGSGRRLPWLPLLAGLAGLVLLGAAIFGLLAITGLVPGAPFKADGQTPTPAGTPGGVTSPVTATQGVNATTVASPTSTLDPAGAVEPSPSPSLEPVTLVAPAASVEVTSVVTFTWDFGPVSLPEGVAYQLVIGQGDPPESGAVLIRETTQDEMFVLDARTALTATGEFYWTVVLVEPEDEGRPLSRAQYRGFTYLGPAVPSPVLSPTPGGG